MWEKELKIIDGLGKLYPDFSDDLDIRVRYEEYGDDILSKSFWLTWLCEDHLKSRLPSLEKFLRRNNKEAWNWYRAYFKMDD